jgi:hypothetical protein
MCPPDHFGTSTPLATASRASPIAFGSPAVGQADDEQAGVACRLEHTFFTGRNARFASDGCTPGARSSHSQIERHLR